jgi:uncharacterized protein YozE (UPF0346 family)
MKKRYTGFRAWLAGWEEDDSPVGDLAADAATDGSFPEHIESYEQLRSYLRGKNASRAALAAAREAWGKWVP